MNIIDFEIIPGEYTSYEVWKCIDGEKINIAGMFNDITEAIKLVDLFYKIYHRYDNCIKD